ncbi:MAG: 4-(cytidine 5'-diphospho)-2-C-methyl-D-erythritol kinase [Oscillospiraceae bacterium]|nr:4-(cytidine 5'-diphospho)-2-C-methyl-D-erythritol kinase [Oscillospiraceae bacterium]MCD8359021.1 4-(cytidine 5'-diphospho)-2-C-methyl-D-erythritol kinase [Oscillospiraceae bacterium]
MNTIDVKAYAKLNLSLDVLGRLEGGYHAMKMVMQSASLCDDIHIALTEDGSFGVQTNFGFLPRDDRNIALRAAKEFLAAAGMQGTGARLRLNKRIPVGAGLGGGSTDAAAVLRGLNRLTGAHFSRAALEELGARLGSDVPYCIAGGTRLAEGRGEQLTALPPLPDCGFVICKPGFSIRTPGLFARIDSRRSGVHPDTDGLIAALSAGDISGVARRMYNVFEDVLPANCREIGEIKQLLLDSGALGAVMSGTGSAVFGIFSDLAAAEAAQRKIQGRCRECFAAAPVGEAETE